MPIPGLLKGEPGIGVSAPFDPMLKTSMTGGSRSADLMRIVGAGEVSLNSIPPGEFVLQVTVTDEYKKLPRSNPPESRLVGRAGRALESAYGVLLSGQEDTDVIDYFIETAFPTRDEAQQVLNALEEDVGGLSVPGLMERFEY